MRGTNDQSAGGLAKNTKKTLAWLVSTALASGTAAYAQEPDESGETLSEIEEIVVTAARRETGLQDVPSPLTVIGEGIIDNTGIDDLRRFIEIIPNAALTDEGTNRNSTVSVRGVGASPTNLGDQGVGLYRNGGYVGGPRVNLGRQIDVKRVEVLRGPQGGLYGRNAVGGSINIVYGTPTDERSLEVNGEYQNLDRLTLSAIVNSPLSDTFALRLVGWYDDQDKGEYFNTFDGQYLDAFTDKGGRVSARWDVTPDITVTWLGEYQENEINAEARTFIPQATTFFGQQIAETKKTISRDTIRGTQTENIYLSQDIAWQSGFGEVKLLTTYRSYELEQGGDQDQAAPPIGPVSAGLIPPIGIPQQTIDRADDEETYFAELTWLSPTDQALTWVTGITYLEDTFDTIIDIRANADIPGAGLVPLTGASPTVAFFGDQKTTSWAVWGEFTYAVSTQLDIIASARYSRDRKSGDVGLIDPLFFLGGGYTFNARDTFKDFAPAVGLNYQFNDEFSVFARVATGFRPGGFDETSLTAADVAFDSETSINHELGFKSAWLDKRLTFNGTAFLLEQKDVLVPVPTINPAITNTDNLGKARTWGLEFEGLANPVEGLTIGFALGFLDPEFTRGPFEGNRVPGSPDTTLSLFANYVQPIADKLDFIAASTFRQRWGGSIDPLNTLDLDNYSLMDVSAGLQGPNWKIMGFVENLFDDTYILFQQNFPAGNAPYNPGAPFLGLIEAQGATYGIRTQLRF